MKALTHRLVDVASGKRITLTARDNKLFSETGKDGARKTTEKEFDSPQDTVKNFYKKEWEALKKGFVLHHDEAEAGEPMLHKFIGGGYTGCLSFQETPQGIFVYKNSGHDTTLIDQLVLIDPQGNLIKEVVLPEALPWSVEYRRDTNSLLLDLDHYIFEYDIERDTFKNLGDPTRDHTSFLSLGNGKAAFATAGKITVVNSSNEVVSSQPYTFETIKGSTPFCGTISGNGTLLAFHNKVGEINIMDIRSGEIVHQLTGAFAMVEQMAFSSDNKLLIVREQYGSWGMKYFDLEAKKAVEIKGLDIPAHTQQVDGLCFNTDQSRLVLIQRDKAHVFDFPGRKLLYSFKIDHVVKRCKAKFIGSSLGIRTDYGCFSLYKI